jgi:hypothetical protein
LDYRAKAGKLLKEQQIGELDQDAKIQRILLSKFYKEQDLAGLMLEDESMHVDVAGYKGPLAAAPELNMVEKPTHKKDTLWVEKVKPGEKGTFLLYSPVFQGVYTHYRGKGIGTVLCFRDRSLCVGGHEEGTLRWHGFLHAFHFEKNRQVFLHVTPEGRDNLLAQVAEGACLRGLRISVRRPKDAPKGPYYVTIIGDSEVSPNKLPKHRDARASIFNMFQIKPKGRMANAAFAGGEDVPTGEGS